MNRLLLVTFLFSVLQLSLSAQDSETRDLSSFKGVSASASVDVTLVKGNRNEAEITVKNVELDDVVTEINNGILKVGMDGKGKKWSWGKNKRRKVAVTVTYTDDLEYLSVSSSADLICDDVISGDYLEIKASSSGDMSVSVDVEELEATVSSSADIEIDGSADEASITASSSADFLGKRLDVNNAEVSASSSADIEISVANSLEARASSSADITYYGNPELHKVKKSSSGAVTRGGR